MLSRIGLLVVTLPVFALDRGAIARLMTDGDVAGLSLAVLRDGKVAEVGAFGVRNMSTKTPVTERTMFEAASLSKPVFAYAVLQLVDAGKLSLDERLSKYLPDYVTDDARASSITARQILSHTTGFPNWRRLPERPLKTYFAPGERFSYSGEGYVYLAKVVEKITGESLDAVVKRLVFDPLEMRDSSYVWQSRFDEDYSDGHDSALRASPRNKRGESNAAASLQTTAGDYGRFLQAVLAGSRLKPETAAMWTRPQVKLTKRCAECLDPKAAEFAGNVGWALGWGIEGDSGTFFHWGDNGRFKCFVLGSVKDRSVAVVFTNSSEGQSIMPELMRVLGQGEHPAFSWLRYERYNSARRLLLRAAMARGIESAWRDLDGGRLDAGERRALASDLKERGRAEDALWVGKQ